MKNIIFMKYLFLASGYKSYNGVLNALFCCMSCWLFLKRISIWLYIFSQKCFKQCFQLLGSTSWGVWKTGSGTCRLYKRQVQKSDRINSDCQSGSDRLGPTRIEKKNKNKIKLDLDQLGSLKKNNSHYIKRKKNQSVSLNFQPPFCFFLTNSWLRKLI